jgi:peptidoglycan/LPS O-acetylase OafA/YrhL
MRRPDIQGLRAVAVLAVIIYHAGLPVYGGFIGVDIFFVISGFVITGSLSRQFQLNGRIKFTEFFYRRFRRLAPAVSAMVAVSLLLSAFILSPFGPQLNVAKTGIGAMFGFANGVVATTSGGYFDASSITNPLLHTWSLSVEEQFYVFFPLILGASLIYSRRRSTVLSGPKTIVSVFALGSFILSLLLELGVEPASGRVLLEYFSPLTRAWEFAVGALIFLNIENLIRLTRRFAMVFGTIGLAILTFSFWIINDLTPFPGPWALLPVIGTSMIIISGSLNSTTFVFRVLSARQMVQLGERSYSLYLWHWPAVVFAGYLWPSSPGMLALSLFCAFFLSLLSYTFIEMPFRAFGTAKARVSPLFAGSVVLIPTLLASGLWIANKESWWNESIRQMSQQIQENHVGQENGCAATMPLGKVPDGCSFNGLASGKPVYLLGDSNAEQFGDGLVGATKNLGRPLLIATGSSCPFVNLLLVDKGRNANNAKCRYSVQTSLAFLESAKEGTVIIANSDKYGVSPDYDLMGTQPDSAASMPTDNLVVWAQALLLTIENLQADGHQVLIFQAIPKWGEADDVKWDPTTCTMRSVITHTCAAKQKWTHFAASNERTRTVLAVVALKTGATLWDPSVELCRGGECTTLGPGFTRYRDAGHLSVAQSNSLKLPLMHLLEGSK